MGKRPATGQVYDVAMVKPTSTTAIATATHRAWDDWIKRLSDAGAEQLDHTAIAALAVELMPESVEQKEWWAQGVAIAFEQHTGLRVPGQGRDGRFRLSVSRTVPGDMDATMLAWTGIVEGRSEFGGVAVASGPTATGSERWRYWKASLADGSRVALNISEKQGKSAVALEHTVLDSPEAIERWRPIWKGLLAEL